MAEGTEEVIVDAPNEGTHISTVEDQARDQGWVPKDEFDGDEHKWVEAGEFIRRGELFKKIDQVQRTAKRAEQTLAQFKDHYLKMQDIANKNAIAALKAERKEARAVGDFEKMDEVDDRIKETEAASAAAVQEIRAATSVPEIHPEVAEWVTKNEWYNKDLPMKAYADAVAANLNKQGIVGPELLKGIDAEVRKAFPTKFSNPNRSRPGAVESSTNRGTASKTRDSFELTEQETRIMNNWVRDGVLTKDEYIRDLKKAKGIA